MGSAFAAYDGRAGNLHLTSAAAEAVITDCIFARNTGGESDTATGRSEWAGQGKADVYTSSFPTTVAVAPDILKGTPLSIDPVFVDAAGGDYHVKPGTATCDRGTYEPDLPEIDLDGRPRLVGIGVDLGCYETADDFTASFVGPSDPRGFVASNVAYVAAASGTPDGKAASFDWSIVSPSGKRMTATGGSYVLTPDECGDWTVAVTATAGGRTTEPYVRSYSVYPSVLYVVAPSAEHRASFPYAEPGLGDGRMSRMARERRCADLRQLSLAGGGGLAGWGDGLRERRSAVPGHRGRGFSPDDGPVAGGECGGTTGLHGGVDGP